MNLAPFQPLDEPPHKTAADHLRTGLGWFRVADEIGDEVAQLLAVEAVDRALAVWPGEQNDSAFEAAWALRTTLVAWPGVGATRALLELEERVSSSSAAE